MSPVIGIDNVADDCPSYCSLFQVYVSPLVLFYAIDFNSQRCKENKTWLLLR